MLSFFQKMRFGAAEERSQDDEDTKWARLEEGCMFQQSCAACLSLTNAASPMCDVCGSATEFQGRPSVCSDMHVDEEAIRAPDEDIQIAVASDEALGDIGSDFVTASSEKEEQGECNDVETQGCVPTVGSKLMIFCNDGKWHRAYVKAHRCEHRFVAIFQKSCKALAPKTDMVRRPMWSTSSGQLACVIVFPEDQQIIRVVKDAYEDEVSIRRPEAPGCAPQVGTLLEVQCEDETWHRARVCKSTGAKAIVTFEADFDDHGEAIIEELLFPDDDDIVRVVRISADDDEESDDEDIASTAGDSDDDTSSVCSLDSDGAYELDIDIKSVCGRRNSDASTAAASCVSDSDWDSSDEE